MLPRLIEINVPADQSFFLWGARQTGKSSFLVARYPNSLRYDLLNTELFLRYVTEPYLFSTDVLSQSDEKLRLPIIIDEIQKVPILLNEAHRLIEQSKLQFILCGSSARKLRTQSTNLLGGRAWLYHFYPFVYPEIPHFDLFRALQHGLLPKHYLLSPEHIRDSLEAYVNVYLTDEIQREGLVRNLASFAHFLKVAGLCNGEIINMSSIARDCHIDRSSVQGYFQILIDTLIGYFVYPHNKKIKRDLLVMAPKFYFFDVGVANYLASRELSELRGDAAGKSFEHYIFMELLAYRGLKHKRFEIQYWRTKTGLEVDFILGDLTKAQVAIEVKISKQVHQQDLKGLIAFCEEHPAIKAYVVSQDYCSRKLEVKDKINILILPWKDFLEKLWVGEII